jgi:putative NIF3 family GTP cyclohydrolase 1 type 2
MVTVRSVLEALERLAPSRTAFEWDRIGLQVGDPAHEVTAAVVALDPSPSLLDFAVAARAEFLLCHHPVIWDPLKSLTTETRSGRLASKMASLGLSFVAAHTNWDAAPNGINGRLSDLLGLRDSGSVGAGQKIAASKIDFMSDAHSVRKEPAPLSDQEARILPLAKPAG